MSGGISNGERGVWGGGHPDTSNMYAVTINTESNAYSAIGYLDQGTWGVAGASNDTRGLFFGGTPNPGGTNQIQYITIETAGNASSFGTQDPAGYNQEACANSTRALVAGVTNGSDISSNIDYVTIASTGNSSDFGSLSQARSEASGTSGADS